MRSLAAFLRALAPVVVIGISLGTALLQTNAATWLANIVVAEFGLKNATVLFILGVDKISAENDLNIPYYIIDSNGKPHFSESFIIFSTINK